MKDNIKVIGIDDGYFLKHKTKRVMIIGAVMRGNTELEGVVSSHVTKDGTDATSSIVKMINDSRHKNQLRFIMVNGLTFGGFNVLDIRKVNEKTRLPVISVIRKRPDFRRIENALANFSDGKKRLAVLKKAGDIYSHKRIYFQIAGLSEERAREVIDKTLRNSNIPEPIRMAHLIASGVTYGESTKRA